VECRLVVDELELRPQRPKSLLEVWKLTKAAHLQAAPDSTGPVEFDGGAVPPRATEAELWSLITHGVSRDGAFVFSTRTPEAQVGHLLFVSGGKLYLHTALAVQTSGPQCGGAGETVTSISGGGAKPWVLQLEGSDRVPTEMCRWASGVEAPCSTAEEEEGTSIGETCTWADSRQSVMLFDTDSFEGVTNVEAVVTAADVTLVDRTPRPLLSEELREAELVARACGQTRTVPFARR